MVALSLTHKSRFISFCTLLRRSRVQGVTSHIDWCWMSVRCDDEFIRCENIPFIYRIVECEITNACGESSGLVGASHLSPKRLKIDSRLTDRAHAKCSPLYLCAKLNSPCSMFSSDPIASHDQRAHDRQSNMFGFSATSEFWFFHWFRSRLTFSPWIESSSVVVMRM